MELVPQFEIISKIYLVRNEKIMLDRDLAELYGVETKYLKRQVRRNIDRFPEDFMFELRKEEFTDLRSQIDTSSWGGTRYMPMAFTEQGVAQLSSVLNSDRAIQVNIQIIRLFTYMRRLLESQQDLVLKLEKLERSVSKNSDEIKLIFKAIHELFSDKKQRKLRESRKRIGFNKDE